MPEFIDIIGHAREYDFTAPADAYPHRRLVDPLRERRQRYMAQGRTWTDAADLAVLAALHKRMCEGFAHYTREIDTATQRIAELEARVQQLTNSANMPMRPIPELDEAEAELAEDARQAAVEERSQTLNRLSAAQERKRRRAQLAQQAKKRAADEKLRKQYAKQVPAFSIDRETIQRAACMVKAAVKKVSAKKKAKRAR